MKKLKIMLLSFALLAIVGGALAFKAKTTSRYCTAPVNQNPLFGLCTFDASVNKTCPFTVFSTTAGANVSFCYTTPQDIDGDNQIDDCEIVGVATLRCITTTTNLKGN